MRIRRIRRSCAQPGITPPSRACLILTQQYPGQAAPRMTQAAYPFKLPNSMKRAAQRLAKEVGVSPATNGSPPPVAQKVGSSRPRRAVPPTCR
jgi:hypothetical protein